MSCHCRCADDQPGECYFENLRVWQWESHEKENGRDRQYELGQRRHALSAGPEQGCPGSVPFTGALLLRYCFVAHMPSRFRSPSACLLSVQDPGRPFESLFARRECTSGLPHARAFRPAHSSPMNPHLEGLTYNMPAPAAVSHLEGRVPP